MGRPSLSLGTHGKIRCYRSGFQKFRARAKYRDYDGVVREVERSGTSKAGATKRLQEALRDRARAGAAGDVTERSRIRDVAALWLTELEESGKAVRTKETYRRSWEHDLRTPVESLRVFEVTVSIATRVLQTIRDNNGPGSAKHAKVVLSGILGVAVRHDAIDRNPVREVALGQSTKVATAEADKFVILESELIELRKYLRESDHAKRFARQDLLDLVDMLAALGCRIGELLALDWAKIDLESGTVAIEGTVIREKGVGLFVQPHTKSDAGMRTIYVPSWAVNLLARRRGQAQCEWVFPSARGTLRDPDNTRADLRDAVAETPWAGLHPHAFRHMVATRLDESGLSAREIADYLGHEKVSMTQDVYMNRKVAGSAAAEALGGLRLEG